MLEISAQKKTTPFTFVEVDGTNHKLEITQYTVADVKKLMELQKPIIDDKGLDIVDQSTIIVASTIACGVKSVETGEHYWSDVEDMLNRNYPNDLFDSLYHEVKKVNPTKEEQSLDEKKS